MLPSMRHFFEYIELDKAFDEYGFYKKVGAAFRLGHDKPEGYTDFIAVNANNYAWNVVRSEADALMLEHAGSSGVKVYEQTRVTDIQFDTEQGKPISATWSTVHGDVGTVYFDYLVDASGRRGLLSTKYLKNRRFIQSLKNKAIWSYWINTNTYRPNTAREGAPFFEALKDQSGWAWFIPLHNGTTSVGIVMKQEIYLKKKSAFADTRDSKTFYLQELQGAIDVMALIGRGQLATNVPSSTVMRAGDYSYDATSYAGNQFRIVGDAGAFIDPFFSNGIHLAVSGGLSAAATICAVIRGDCSEVDAIQWHNSRIGISYTRFLVVVLSAYQQMQCQTAPVLTDIDNDNFDQAFRHFRSVIQGDADVAISRRDCLTEEELRETLEFCAKAYMPSDDEDQASKIELNRLLGSSESIHALSVSGLNGFCINLVRGQLGLRRTETL